MTYARSNTTVETRKTRPRDINTSRFESNRWVTRHVIISRAILTGVYRLERAAVT